MDSGAVGNLALWGAVGACAASVTARRRPAAPLAARAALILATVAVGALAWSLLTGNFALTYVADTTTRQGSWPYRLAGLWGGNGGSLLVWAWIILIAGLGATRHRPSARLVAMAAGGSVLLIDAWAANPFRRLAIPAIDGGGLTPILQYPAMLYHPILLYAGHAGLVAPFALAVAAMATGQQDRVWLATTRRWMLGAWLLLGMGLVAGAHWSYVELRWGGFWGWDPVENSGLLPWLAATAFLHAARTRTVEGDGPVPPGLGALAVLAAAPFCFSLLGAAVSRSGAAQSVHAFAQATAVGRGLSLVLAAAVATVVLLAVRGRRQSPASGLSPARAASTISGTGTGLQSRALLGGVLVLLVITAAVAVGTVFPVLVHATTGQTVAVTARYYAVVVTPLAVVGVLLMGVAPSLHQHQRQRLRPGWRRPARWVGAGGVALVAVGLLAAPGRRASVVLGGAAAGAAVLTAVELAGTRSLRRAGALIAHVGMALLLLGVAGSLLGHQSTQVIRPGGEMSLGGYTIRYRDVVLDQGAGWQRARTVLEIDQGGRRVAVLLPGLRVFPGQGAALSDVAIRARPAEDLIVAVRAIDPASRAADLEVTVRPLVLLVWWGGLLVAAGGSVVLASAWAKRGRAPHHAPVGSGAPAAALPLPR